MSKIVKLAIFLFPLSLMACDSEQGNSPGVASTMPDAAAVQDPIPELGTFGIDLSHQDRSVEPGNDFFRYANGRWLDTYELPADRNGHGMFDVLADRSDERVRTIVDDLTNQEPVRGTIEQKISDYYLSYMNTDALNALGITPLRPILEQLQQIASIEQLTAAFGRTRIDATASPFSFGIGPDRNNPDAHQLSLSIGGISLPDRDYYLLDTDRFIHVRQEFVRHISRMLSFANIDETEAKAAAILQLETQIAERMWPRADRRNRDLTYNPMTFQELVAAYPGFDWIAYFSAAGIAELDTLNVLYPSAMAPIIELINTVPLEDWKSYLVYQFISSNASALSEAIDNENFAFYSTVLNGVPEQRERWERGVARVGALNSLGEAIGQVYVQRHFPQSAKDQMTQLVENLRAALAQSIAEIDWMGETTKIEANLKLNAFRPKIAYPDEWKDLSAIEITRDDLFANLQSVREFNYQEELLDLGRATNREEWGMTPQTVNAYYNASFNEIVFPAGILQPPFFDPAADLAVNYGGIAAVIGHEMGHGFDDQGSKVDSLGVQRNWWTDADRTNFDRLTTALAAQYSEFEPVSGSFIDGNFTLGENIGDVGGLSLAYRAYKMALGGEEAPVIEGLTGDQRFFLSWAQMWQAKHRDDALVQRLTSDPHSPPEFRVNGVVRNFDEWYEAFDVQPGDALYLPPEERIRIW